MTPYHRIILLPIPVGRRPGRLSYDVFHRRELHELATAKTLLRFGYDLQFTKASTITGQTSADCRWRGHVWEMKAPTGNGYDNTVHNLSEALDQSQYIILDTSRSRRTVIQRARDVMNYCHERSGRIDIREIIVIDRKFYCILTRDMLK